MEYCIEAIALKPSLRREITKQTHHAHSHAQSQFFVDELIFETEAHAGVGGNVVDDFLIDDLLDFPNKKDAHEKAEEEVSECSLDIDDHENAISTVTCDVDANGDDFFSDAGLAVPQDDLADLEWVSQFFDDSTPEFPPLYPTTRKPQTGLKPSGAGSGSLPVQFNQPIHMNRIFPAKPRTKRQRVGRVWSIGSTAGSESSTTTSSSSITSSNLVRFGFGNPVVKRQKTILESVRLGDSVGRRCSHCLVQKTPQWRAGPEGPKTLCNACGVRFKSGRLYPEYRPACSPTFRGDVHSNSHRKVLEMRRKKDVGNSGSAVQSI